MYIFMNMDSPQRPNDDTNRQKERGSGAQQTMDILDDTTLMVVVTFIYAFFHFFSRFNAPNCTC